MDSTRLAQIRKEYYLSTRQQVESILGGEPADLKSYRESYEKELSQSRWVSSDKRHFMNRIKKAQIVLVGDFHALKQSSRTLLRLLRKETGSLVLGLECLDIKDQTTINKYVNGKISEKDFLQMIEWKKKWGFPWENYRPILKWAQVTKTPIFALSDFRIKNLKKRDQRSAEIIHSIFKQSPSDRKMYIQYGDLHLATSHLPKEIKKLNLKNDLCVVLQSPEIIYFKVMAAQKDHLVDVVRINNDLWALSGLPPWVKWQDYLLYLESGQDRRIKIDDHDITDRVSHVVQLLNQSFGFNVGVSSLSVYSSQDDHFFSLLEKLPATIRKRILEQIKDGTSFFIPEIETGYLARHSINHIARIASQYLYYMLGLNPKTFVDPEKNFFRLIWFEMVIYLCVKVANPKRKTDTLHDIRIALQKEQFDDRGKEALSIALTQKLNEMKFLAHGQARTKTFKTKANRKSIQSAAQILGGIMGEKLYFALNKKIIQLPKHKNLIFKNLALESFADVYYESLEMIESWPETFKSKFDKL